MGDGVTSGETVAAIAGRIYDAAVESDKWPDTLKRLAAAFRTKAALLRRQVVTSGQVSYWVSAGLDDQYTSMFCDQYTSPSANRLVERISRLPVGTPVTRQQLTSDAEYVRREAYIRVFLPQEVALGASVCVLKTSNDEAIILSLLHQRLAHDVNGQELGLLSSLVPHLQCALRIQQCLGEVRFECVAAEHALDWLPIGVVLVDAEGRPLFMNKAAEEMVQHEDGLSGASAALADPAVVISNQGCGMLDGDGNFVFADRDITVDTQSDNENIKLRARLSTWQIARGRQSTMTLTILDYRAQSPARRHSSSRLIGRRRFLPAARPLSSAAPSLPTLSALTQTVQ